MIFRTRWGLILGMVGVLGGPMKGTAQVGIPEITNFPPLAYYSDTYQASPQNWAVIQDGGGLLYVANESGILTFDGDRWTMVQGSELLRLFKLAEGPNGRIYSGGVGDLGFVGADSLGRPLWQSLKQALPDSAQDFQRIARTVAHEGKVYFLGRKWLFGWDGQGFKVWTSKEGYSRIFSTSKGLLVTDQKRGLLRLENDIWVPYSDGTSLVQLGIRGIHSMDEDGLLLFTYDQGVYRFSEGQTERVESRDDSILIFNTCVLPDGRIAAGTNGHGVYIFNLEGQVEERLGEAEGLQQNQVVWPYVDREGALWVSLFSGISRINYPTALTRISKESGLPAIVVSMRQYDSYLYVGTLNGCYRLKQSATNPMRATLQRIKGIREETWQILVAGGRLVAVAKDGLFEIDAAGVAQRILPEIGFQAGCVAYGDVNQLFLVYGNKLISLGLRHQKWVLEGPTFELPQPVFSLTQDSMGRLWAGYQSLFMVPDPTKKSRVITVDSTLGLFSDVETLEVLGVDGNAVIGSNRGILEWDETKQRLEPSQRFGKRFAGGEHMAYTLCKTTQGDLWLTTTGHTGVLRQANGWALDSLPLITADFTEAWAVYEDSNKVIWVSTTEGLLRYDPNTKKRPNPTFSVRLSQVMTHNDSLLQAGWGSDATRQQLQELPYSNNRLAFYYSAGWFGHREKLQYSTWLEGQESIWSPWTSTSNKEYTNLKEGDYVFKVRARNLFGEISSTTKYPVRILPPWYRRVEAYAVFGLLALAFLWLILRLNTIRLRKAKKQLEAIVKSRTSELSEQTEVLRETNIRLEELDRYKEGMTNMIVHDLKNPLNAILSVDESLTLPKQVDRLKRSGGQMLNLVMDMLDVSRYEKAGMKLKCRNLSGESLLKMAFDQVKFLADQKRIHLLKKVIGKGAVLGEKEVLVRVLVNLLTNAIKFSPPSSEVVVSFGPLGNTQWRFGVRDEGPGISKENQEKIFDKFGQAAVRESGNVRATGLGLTFCKMAVEAHGGSIALISEPKAGTEFWFTVPASTTLGATSAQTDTSESMEGPNLNLNQAEKHYIKEFAQRLQGIPVYKVTQLEDIINEINAGTDGVKQWIQSIRQSIYLGDRTGMQQALDLVLSGTQEADQ